VTFLQPFILWALPVAMLPVLIHLLNRMRYRTMPWAAMMFLISASRHSVRQARLRHFLLLAARVGAVLALLVALARPLIGGWLGWRLRGAPDLVFLLLDRSASMELADSHTHVALRQRALQRLADAARDLAGTARFVVLDSATRQPHEIASSSLLGELSATGVSDTAADIPALLDAAVDYLLANRVASSELWLATDLQASNWQPHDPRWARWQARVAALPEDVRIRVLALTAHGDNASVSISQVRRQRNQLWLTLDITGHGSLPVSIGIEGARTLVDVNVTGDRLRFQQKIDLGTRTAAGWGGVELPPDANDRDNRWWFAFPEEQTLRAVVVASDEKTGRRLQLAAAPAPQLLNQSALLLRPGEPIPWEQTALVVWAAGEPPAQLETFGGTALIFPAEAPATPPMRVTRWRREDGPLASTQDGQDLPVNDLVCAHRRTLTNDATVLATFEDGQPFLTRQGLLYRCAALPAELGDGRVLVPMLQRLLADGGARFGHVANLFCDARQVTAGVAVAGAQISAWNRPPSEDDWERVDEPTARASFGKVPVTMFEENSQTAGRLQSELWQWFIGAMVGLLIAESLLAMPEAHR